MNEKDLRVCLRNVTKIYGGVTAISNISLDLGPGEIFGFIGPNGAGKTTTLKILATLLKPTQGTAFVDGINVVNDPDLVRSKIGYMPDTFGVYDDFRVWEYLAFFASAYKVQKSAIPGLIDLVLDLTNLSTKKDTYIESLSHGMKQRLCLARTMVHDPTVLLLDEPASGLDPRARIELRDLLKELQKLGKTVVISSHILLELSDFCTSIGIIECGNLIISGPIEALTKKYDQGRVLHIHVPSEDIESATAVLGLNPSVISVSQSRGELVLKVTGGLDEQSQLLMDLLTARVRIIRFEEPQDNLEDVFMRHTKGILG